MTAAGTKIGFVGLGSMGLPMAENLVTAGHEVAGYDTGKAAAQALANAGGTAANSAVEAFRGAECDILMVVNAAQAEAVLFAEDAIKALAPGATVMLMATCQPAATVAVPEAGRGAKAPLPIATLAHQLFLDVSARGMGAADDSQVIRAYRRLRAKQD